jgi:plasmid stabilization system protein ParE
VKTYAVVFAPEAEGDLVELFEYIAGQGSPTNATRYTEAIVAYCEMLITFPHRGMLRDDIRPGLRVTDFRKRAVIVFRVDNALARISILGVYYGGRDFERAQGSFEEGSEEDPG